MSPKSPDDEKEQPQKENYIHDPNGIFTKRVMGARTVATCAAFLLPHLRPGQRLLDLGSGLGTITIGLAEAVSPGKVVGIDVEEGQVKEAREKATEQGVSNIRFEVGDAYQLDFESESFDVVYSNALLEHLRRPVDVLKEAWRVLKPGGIAGVRTAEWGTMIWGSDEPLLNEYTSLYLKHRQYSGGDPFIGRRLRALLREAGFVNTQFSASCSSGRQVETSESIKAGIEATISEWVSPNIREVALRLGWADEAYLDSVEQAFRKYSENPDSCSILARCEAVGWKP